MERVREKAFSLERDQQAYSLSGAVLSCHLHRIALILLIVCLITAFIAPEVKPKYERRAWYIANLVSQKPQSKPELDEPNKFEENLKEIVTRPALEAASKLHRTQQKRPAVQYASLRDIPRNSSVISNGRIFRKLVDIIRRSGKKVEDPYLLATKIINESAREQFDPLFVAAVIKSESAFDRFATSNVGAKGLMQIMPKTGEFIERLKGYEPVMGMRLTDSNYNVRLGVAYLKHLEELYDGNRVFVLTAYNWGPGRVEDAMNGKRRIPKDVMNYALKILSDHRTWRYQLASAV